MRAARACLFSLLLFFPAAFAQAAEAPAELEEPSREYQAALESGLAAYVDGQYLKAIDSFEKALAIKPNDKTAKKALKSVKKRLRKQHSVKDPALEREIGKTQKYLADKQYLVAVMSAKSLQEKNKMHPSVEKLVKKIGEKVDSLISEQRADSYSWNSYKGMKSYLNDQIPESLSYWKRAVELNPDDQLTSLAIEEAMTRQPAPSGLVSTRSEEPCDCELPKSSGAVANLPMFDPSSLWKATPSISESTRTAHSVAAPAKSAASVSAPVAPVAKSVSKSSSTAPVYSVSISTPAPAAVVGKSTESVPAAVLAASTLKAVAPVQAPSQPAASQAKSQETPKPVVPPLAQPPQPEAAAPKAEIPADLSAAEKLAEKKEFPAAIRLLQDFLKAHPGNVEAEDLLARTLSERDAASASRYNQGLLEYANGNYSQAIEEWKAVLKIHPEHPSARKIILKAFFKARPS